MPDHACFEAVPVGRDTIAAAARLIGPHVRRTPNLDMDPGDLGEAGLKRPVMPDGLPKRHSDTAAVGRRRP